MLQQPAIADPPKSRRGDAIHPGCGYSDEEIEFLKAIDTYKREKRRPHPSWTEVLGVLRSLGWKKIADPS